MPIHINYAAKPQTDWDEKGRVKKPVFGKNEIADPAQWQFYQRGYDAAARTMTFAVKNDVAANAFGDVVMKTHAWMSDNIQGPWLLEDGWANHGHCYDCYVHIERFDERDVFEQSSIGKHFSRIAKRDPSMQELSDLMILKGLASPIGKDESFQAWCDDRQGYEVEYVDIDSVPYALFKFDHADVQKSFVQEVVPEMPLEACDNNIYRIPRAMLGQRFSIYNSWSEDNAGICLKSGGHLNDPQWHKYKLPYKDIEKEFKEQWGTHFEYDADKGVYYCSMDAYPFSPVREATPAFIDYMHGHGSDPSLKPMSL